MCAYERDELPEFDRNKKIDQQGAFVFTGECIYDVILGRDFLVSTGIDIQFADSKIQWMNITVDLKENVHNQQRVFHIGQNNAKAPDHDVFTTTILDANIKQQVRSR